MQSFRMKVVGVGGEVTNAQKPVTLAQRWPWRRRLLVLAIAAGLDAVFGELPNDVHPVAGLGRLIGLSYRRPPTGGAVRQFAWGAGVTATLSTLAGTTGWTVGRWMAGRGGAGVMLEAAALKPLFALRMLLTATVPVERGLLAGDLESARQAVSRIVSRDTSTLGPGLVAAAAIESAAENFTDSVIAPWLAYLACGLPAAAIYRLVNTMDSMVGYRGENEYLGKAPARVDDLLNLVPARLGALLIALAAPAGGGSTAGALRIALRDHDRTASPNAGWTMAAMAGALGVRLEKRNHYCLGSGAEPTAQDIARARRIVACAAVLGLVVVGGTSAKMVRLASHK